jgi:hypothetical protein
MARAILRGLHGKIESNWRSDFIGIIKRRAELGIVVSVRQSDIALLIEEGRDAAGGAYLMCLLWCVAGVSGWVNKHGLTGKIAYFFESGHPLQTTADKGMQLISRTEKLRAESLYHAHTFIKKDAAQALQAADLLFGYGTKSGIIDSVKTSSASSRPGESSGATAFNLPFDPGSS